MSARSRLHRMPPLPGWSALLLAAALLQAIPAFAQLGAGTAVPSATSLVHATATPVVIAAGRSAEVRIAVEVQSGWHVNANPPSPDYMIPTQLTVDPASGLTAGTPRYPKPKPLKVDFEDSMLLVYSGRIEIGLPLAAARDAVSGLHRLTGKLQFQACNDQVCLAPVSVPVELEVTVTGGRAPTSAVPESPNGRAPAEPAAPGMGSPAAADTGSSATEAPVPQSGFSTQPPAGTAPVTAVDKLMRKIEGGGWAAFLALFVSGLLLNLTPCVYPMLGVTVSIFGARRAAPPLQVISYALLYVLGMAVMYSSLGLIAAFTGGLFGGLLQNPIVLVVIGLLFMALSLSMFGLYEFQVPPELLSRLGGTTATSAVGIFASGLMVGVFAAPCIGPVIVALLALVAARGDPWFGFYSFFVLSMGLGAPYLVLGTFSNLLQTLPRSGEWMVWVKKVFGVILFSVGAFYALLALAPAAAVWVIPAALMLGGVYLGFFERSADRRAGFRWFKRLSGGIAAVAGVMIVATAPSEGIAFENFTAEALEASLHGETPIMLDFSADWCAPCHELERFTFTDRRVRDAAKSFRAFRVDLTRYDSPESERWRRRFDITGVPTVLFLTADGSEIRTARVEGFLPPERFLERMRRAMDAGRRAAS